MRIEPNRRTPRSARPRRTRAAGPTPQIVAHRFPSRFLQGYVRGKLRHDPVYETVHRLIRDVPAPVLDVGCGLGLLAHDLNAREYHVPYLGLDIDAGKIAIARRAATALDNTSFDHVSCTTLPPWHGHVVLLDVLHYLAEEVQQQVLAAAASRVAPGAALIIRTVLRDRSWRFCLTRLEETGIRCSGWIRGGVRHYPDLGQLQTILSENGVEAESRPLFGRTPFNSYLVYGRPATH